MIAAAPELLATVPWRQFTLEAVATRAGVTRVTVYNQVRNKAGLLDAVLTESTSRGGMDQLLTDSRDLGPAEALSFVVAQTCRFWHGERAVLRPLFGLAAGDTGIADHLAGREDRRRAVPAAAARTGRRGSGRGAGGDVVPGLRRARAGG